MLLVIVLVSAWAPGPAATGTADITRTFVIHLLLWRRRMISHKRFHYQPNTSTQAVYTYSSQVGNRIGVQLQMLEKIAHELWFGEPTDGRLETKCWPYGIASRCSHRVIDLAL